jgi:hypothetical protein
MLDSKHSPHNDSDRQDTVTNRVEQNICQSLDFHADAFRND